MMSCDPNDLPEIFGFVVKTNGSATIEIQKEIIQASASQGRELSFDDECEIEDSDNPCRETSCINGLEIMVLKNMVLPDHIKCPKDKVMGNATYDYPIGGYDYCENGELFRFDCSPVITINESDDWNKRKKKEEEKEEEKKEKKEEEEENKEEENDDPEEIPEFRGPIGLFMLVLCIGGFVIRKSREP